MGLRYASVRQPHVVVMAPALTETSQPQGFPLKTGTLSSPVSLITINEKAESTLNFDIKCNRPRSTRNLEFLNTAVGMNGDTENITELKTVPLDPCQVELKSCPKDSLGLDKNCQFFDQSIPKESDYSLLQIGGFMMNNTYAATGDDDNMGLQKSGPQVTSMEPCNYLKMDLFKSLAGNNLPQNDLGGGGDFVQNVDEIMQVIKNMESKGNDIEENLESSLQISDGNDITGSLSTFDRDLFNDVDMINMCENLGENGLAIVNKDTIIKERIDEAHERQFKIERKCEWLLRRLRKMQARAMGKQTSEEITDLLKHVSSLLSESSNPSKSISVHGSTVNKVESEKINEENNMCMSTLVRRLDQSSQQQAQAVSQNQVLCKYFGSGSSDNFTSNRQCNSVLSGSILPKLNSEVRKEIDNVSGQLHFQLSAVEAEIDSDVTASSSGGESCDEMQSFNNPQQQTSSILKRAAWKWGQERAAIASRWTWLQAQISDLEYRIRQTNDLNKQIRTAKGGVVLGGAEPPRLSDSVVVNGYHGVLPGKSGDDEVPVESVCRTRPLVRSCFRKRKLLHTAGLHLVSKKAAKPATVQCGCRPPLPSCALCTGRPDPTQPRPDTDLLPLNQRIALLDPAFHPVLSFPCDVSQSLHFDAIMKTSDWQLKSHRLQLKPAAQLTDEGSSTDVSKRLGPGFEHQRRRYYKRSAATALTDRLSSASEERGSESRQSEDDGAESSPPYTGSGATQPSPVPSPGPHCSKERGEAFRRKRENSYDIDNIVIPYSVAASTRLEKLQYKEILTPKWRVIPLEPMTKAEGKNNGLIRRPSQEEGESEDLTEEMLVSRHERCEQEERKKFSTYLKLPNSMARSRGHRRADSRAESSGGNTPDPMSPVGAGGGGECGGSPLTSPPATPQPAESECSVQRRRTTSSRCVSPATLDTIHDEVTPYETRTFPLTDETYEKMLRVMPPGHPFKAYSSTHLPSPRESECESRPTTPVSDSTESADTFVEEDPNDPEWTVDESSLERG